MSYEPMTFILKVTIRSIHLSFDKFFLEYYSNRFIILTDRIQTLRTSIKIDIYLMILRSPKNIGV